MPKIVAPRSFRIQSKGTARLSPDLLLGESFGYRVDKEKSLLWLCSDSQYSEKRVHVWKSGRAKSGSISVKNIFKDLALETKKMYGKVYNVKVIGSVLEIDFLAYPTQKGKP